MIDVTPSLAELAADLAPGVVELRRAIHEQPEIGWYERRTTSTILHALRAGGLDPVPRDGGTGLHVDIGGPAGPVVGFRADLDGLPITERNVVPYASQVPGMMHACGHDAHSAIGVGIALALSRVEGLPGRVRVLFQPAEEQIPGGATAMRDEGLHLGMAALLAFHVDPSLPAGRIGVRQGAITGASDRIEITLSGPGGHTSRPHLTTDLVYAAARLVSDLPTMLRQAIDPRETASLVFGSVNGGTAANVIPTEVTLAGTVRLFDLNRWRDMPQLIASLATNIATPLGAAVAVEYLRGSPPVVNDGDVIGAVAAAGRDVLGAGGVASTHQSLGSEDFAWFLEDVPGALVRLGSAMPDRSVDLHSATFDIDEAALETGILVGSAALIELLRRAAPG
jgi:amidohydrolase